MNRLAPVIKPLLILVFLAGIGSWIFLTPKPKRDALQVIACDRTGSTQFNRQRERHLDGILNAMDTAPYMCYAQWIWVVDHDPTCIFATNTPVDGEDPQLIAKLRTQIKEVDQGNPVLAIQRPALFINRLCDKLEANQISSNTRVVVLFFTDGQMEDADDIRAMPDALRRLSNGWPKCRLHVVGVDEQFIDRWAEWVHGIGSVSAIYDDEAMRRYQDDLRGTEHS